MALDYEARDKIFHQLKDNCEHSLLLIKRAHEVFRRASACRQEARRIRQDSAAVRGG
jgi:hypothetical protein